MADAAAEHVVMIDAESTVLDAARLMTARGIGGLMVRDAAGHMVGIFTERDVLRRVVNDGRDPQATAVAAVMTAPVLTVAPETTVAECRRLFTGRRIRHLPVKDGGELVGVVTSGDVLAFEADEAKATIEHLEGYVFSNR
ncbi:inosine-5-monophosphate dehydrogenase [Gemmatimonadetes bacterium T265]|nr:inosine-5-monophosphate dehydrogenase [Gemmatimonadetes bacterium T265]